MKMEQTECSETSAYKIQTSGNYPEENIEHTKHGEYSVAVCKQTATGTVWHIPEAVYKVLDS
jgi:hypothetical protein